MDFKEFWNNNKKYLPFFCVTNYLKESGKEGKFLPFLGYIMYTAIISASLFSYGKACIKYGEFNPIKQIELSIEGNRKNITEIKKLGGLYNKIFGDNGYADLNHNGKISLVEKIDAYQRMGFNEDELLEERPFPKPNVNQLEKAVQSYEAGKSNK